MDKQERQKEAKKIAAMFIRKCLDGGIAQMLEEENYSDKDIALIYEEIVAIEARLKGERP